MPPRRIIDGTKPAVCHLRNDPLNDRAVIKSPRGDIRNSSVEGVLIIFGNALEFEPAALIDGEPERPGKVLQLVAGLLRRRGYELLQHGVFGGRDIITPDSFIKRLAAGISRLGSLLVKRLDLVGGQPELLLQYPPHFLFAFAELRQSVKLPIRRAGNVLIYPDAPHHVGHNALLCSAHEALYFKRVIHYSATPSVAASTAFFAVASSSPYHFARYSQSCMAPIATSWRSMLRLASSSVRILSSKVQLYS